MAANDPPRRPARFARRLAAALVLLGLCGGLGCGDKPKAPNEPQKQATGRRMPK